MQIYRENKNRFCDQFTASLRKNYIWLRVLSLYLMNNKPGVPLPVPFTPVVYVVVIDIFSYNLIINKLGFLLFRAN